MAYIRALGDNIKRLMDQKEISADELGAAAGLSESDVLRLMEARKVIPPRILLKIAAKLEIEDPETLYTENKEAKHYAMVDCMNEFSKRENEDKVLDIIDAYCDLRDTLIMTETEAI